jgi:cytidylate kinase
MEGRDIATVVFPDANVKIFLTATIDERANRRAKEYLNKGTDLPVEEIKQNLETRDKIDSGRKVSPLKKAEGALTVDTSNLTIDEQVEKIINEVNKVSEKIISR